MIAYTLCRPLLRPSNTYILNRERKVFNYLLFLYYICVESLHLKKIIFFVLANAAKYIKENPSKYALECSKMQLLRYRISKLSEGAHSRTPLE